MDSECPECGTQMVMTESSFTLSTRPGGSPNPRQGTLGFSGYCPNPDCPGKDSDLAKAVGPDGVQS